MEVEGTVILTLDPSPTGLTKLTELKDRNNRCSYIYQRGTKAGSSCGETVIRGGRCEFHDNSIFRYRFKFDSRLEPIIAEIAKWLDSPEYAGILVNSEYDQNERIFFNFLRHPEQLIEYNSRDPTFGFEKEGEIEGEKEAEIKTDIDRSPLLFLPGIPISITRVIE
jgi:hypothetical protein